MPTRGRNQPAVASFLAGVWTRVDNPLARQQKSKPRERVAIDSSSPRDELVAQLRLLTPQAFTEDRFDFAKLRELLGEEIEDRPERFSFTWAGRRDAVAMLQGPTSATLVPDIDESVNFTEAQHVFIEGENLETAKVIYPIAA